MRKVNREAVRLWRTGRIKVPGALEHSEDEAIGRQLSARFRRLAEEVVRKTKAKPPSEAGPQECRRKEESGGAAPVVRGS